MNPQTQEFIKGFERTIELFKQGENIFDMGNVNMLPTAVRQSSWKYSRDGGKLHLSSGTHVFSFHMPEGDHEAPFHAMRESDLPLGEFGRAGRVGTAQVHRSDPGSIYFTLQEGTKNPTYTLRHVGGPKWEATPKKRKVKKETVESQLPSDPAVAAQVKAGMLSTLQELSKQAGFGDFINNHFDFGSLGRNLSQTAGQAVSKLPNAIQHTALLPGRLQDVKLPFNLPPIPSPVAAAGIGAGLGGLYHLGRRTLYNTPEENAQEDAQGNTLLKRMAIPGLGLAALNWGERSMLDNPSSGRLGYYDKARAGIHSGAIPDSGEMKDPLRNFVR